MTNSTHVDRPEDLLDLTAGATLGTSPWIALDQATVVAFGTLTRDSQWIHTDPERARSGPFGTTIVHGYLTLAMCTYFLDQALEIGDAGMAVNYGLDRVRFPAPLPVGARLRGTVHVRSAARAADAVQLQTQVTVQREGHDKPVCVADVVSRFYGTTDGEGAPA